jgi:hypothetical protein
MLCVLLVACGSRTGLVGSEEEEDAAVTLEAALCGPDTCPGCCDATGACRPGTDQEACGIGGADCQACNPLHDVCNPLGGGTHVVGIFCWSPCDVKDCGNGCCTPSGQCLLGKSDDSCGQGTICQDCTAKGETCTRFDSIRQCR